MRRKNDAHKDEVEGVAQRLRNERPEASPLQLDQIKTSAMSRAKTGTRRGRAGARRLATAGLTIGLLAAGTGGVIAASIGHSPGNAAVAQYGNGCVAGNGNGNGGNGGSASGGNGGSANGANGGSANGANGGNDGGIGGQGGQGIGGQGGQGIGGQGGAGGNENGNDDCNNNSFNDNGNTTTTETVNDITTTTVNNYTTNDSAPVTVEVIPAAPAGSSGVLAAKTTKAKTSTRHIKIHIDLGRKSHLKRVTLKLDGKTFKVLTGKAASKNINLTDLPCSTGATTITVIAVTSSGKTVKESHTYNLC